MASFLWLLAGAAWAARVDDPGLVNTVHELHEQFGAIAVLTPNGGDERMVQSVLGADPGVAYLRAGSPSESPSVLQRADIACGLHVARRSGGWETTRVGSCVAGSLAVLPPPPPPLPPPSPEARADALALSHDRLRSTAKVLNGVAIAGTAVLVGSVALGAVPCQGNGFEPCWTGPVMLGGAGFQLALYTIPATQIEIGLLQSRRRSLGLERPPGPGASVAMFAGGIVVALLAGSAVQDDESGLLVVGSTLALGFTGAVIANSVTIHRASPLLYR